MSGWAAGAQGVKIHLSFDGTSADALASVNLIGGSELVIAPEAGTESDERSVTLDSFNATLNVESVKATASNHLGGSQTIAEVRGLTLWLYGRRIVTLDYAASYMLGQETRRAEVRGLRVGGETLKGGLSRKIPVEIAGLEDTKVQVKAAREYKEGRVDAVLLILSLTGERNGQVFSADLGRLTIARTEISTRGKVKAARPRELQLQAEAA